MTNGLDASKVKWLTYLVYLLITLVTIITLYNTETISEFRKDYVKLDRYNVDQMRVESKLDKMIEYMIRK